MGDDSDDNNEMHKLSSNKDFNKLQKIGNFKDIAK